MEITKEVFFKTWGSIRDYINLDELVPILMEDDLVAGLDEYEKLTSGATNGRKQYLFGLLPSKGPDAYQILYQCLQKEKQHRGHEYVVTVLKRTAGI